jgi:alpha-1,3-mannosyltransferase
MRIVHVSRQYAPGIGGLESYVHCLAQEQLKAGHEVRVVTLDRIFGLQSRLPSAEHIEGVAVTRVPWWGSRRYPMAPAILRHLDSCDVVHVHAVDFAADYLARTSLLHGKPLVLSTHGGFFHTQFAAAIKRTYFRHITSRTLRGFRAVIASSLQDYETFAPICDDRLVTVENGVDIARFANLARTDGKTIISFGRIAPNKQPERLLRWFAAVHRLDPDWRLSIAGKPMGVDVTALHQLAGELGVNGAVSIHQSPTFEQLRALVAENRYFASASSYEGFGLTAVEAASAGLYPVLSDIPAHSRTRERLGFGTLTDFASSEAAASFVEQARMGTMTVPSGPSREEALRSFGWGEAAGQIEEIYNRSLGNRSRSIGGLDVQVMDLPMAVRRLNHLIRRREPRVITFCNAHTVITARGNAPFANALRDAFILNDGVGLDWASRLLYGRPFPANLNGTDLIPTLLLRRSRPLRVYLVGSPPGIAARAGDMLKRRNAKLQIVGTDHGFFEEEGEGDVVARIVASAPDVVLVGMGHPRQEIWAERHVQALGVPVICVGALFDFTAEAVLRAPAWMRRTRLEWGYRLICEPRRLARRYLVGNIAFMTGVARDAWRGVHISDWHISRWPSAGRHPQSARGAA